MGKCEKCYHFKSIGVEEYEDIEICGLSGEKTDGCGCDYFENIDNIPPERKELDSLKYRYEKLDLEYHRLKGQFKIVEEALNDNIKKVVGLKAENEKLKTDIAIYKGIIDSNKEENERLKEESENYCIQLQVLAQALEEICYSILHRFKR